MKNDGGFIRLFAGFVAFGVLFLNAYSANAQEGIDCSSTCPVGFRIVAFSNPLACFCYPSTEFPCDMGTRIRAVYMTSYERWLGPDSVTYQSSNKESSEHNPSDPMPTPLVLSIPLGQPFYLLYGAHPSDPTGNNCEPTDQPFIFYSQGSIIDPPLENGGKDSLWPNDILLRFEFDSSSYAQAFYPVHLGQTRLLIQPYGELPPEEVIVNVILPKRMLSQLGEQFDHTEFDELIFKWAHQRGIPPTIMKGQISHETNKKFDPSAYRYEPVTADCKLIQPALAQHERPYTDFKLPYNAATQPDFKNPEDIQPRNHADPPYGIAASGGAVRLLTNEDQPTAAQLVAANLNQNWIYTKVKLEDSRDTGIPLNDKNICSGKILTEVDVNTLVDSQKFLSVNSALASPFALASDYLQFNAQTTTAASYGLYQMMYATAVLEKWKGPDGKQNPSYLTDPETSILNATRYLTKQIKRAARSFGSYDSLQDQFRIGLTAYNKGNFKFINIAYGSKVLKEANSYDVQEY